MLDGTQGFRVSLAPAQDPVLGHSRPSWLGCGGFACFCEGDTINLGRIRPLVGSCDSVHCSVSHLLLLGA